MVSSGGTRACSSSGGISQCRKRRWCQSWRIIDVMWWIKASLRPAFPLAFILLAACSSSAPQSGGPKAEVPEPQIGIEQEHGPSDAGFPYGAFEVKYRFEIQNRADVPLT